MFGHRKVPDVVDKILETRQELVIPIKYMLALWMIGQNKQVHHG